MKQRKSNSPYSKKYFQKPFPPNHNPLIGTMPVDTLCNIRDVIATIQDLTNLSEESNLSTSSATGVHLIFSCVFDALQFEIQHRQ